MGGKVKCRQGEAFKAGHARKGKRRREKWKARERGEKRRKEARLAEAKDGGGQREKASEVQWNCF